MLISTTTVWAQDVYKWVDEKGVTHYSQVQPQNVKKVSIFKTYGQIAQPSSTLPANQNMQQGVPAQSMQQMPAQSMQQEEPDQTPQGPGSSAPVPPEPIIQN